MQDQFWFEMYHWETLYFNLDYKYSKQITYIWLLLQLLLMVKYLKDQQPPSNKIKKILPINCLACQLSQIKIWSIVYWPVPNTAMLSFQLPLALKTELIPKPSKHVILAVIRQLTCTTYARGYLILQKRSPNNIHFLCLSKIQAPQNMSKYWHISNVIVQ